MSWIGIVYYSGWVVVGIMALVVLVKYILRLDRFDNFGDAISAWGWRDPKIRAIHKKNLREMLPWSIALIAVILLFMLLISHLRSEFPREWGHFQGNADECPECPSSDSSP